MTRAKWITKPDGLNGRALEIWKSLAPSSFSNGYLTENNAELFRGLCRAMAVADAASAAVERDGVSITSKSGAIKANPAVKIMFESQREVERLRHDLGLPEQ